MLWITIIVYRPRTLIGQVITNLSWWYEAARRVSNDTNQTILHGFNENPTVSCMDEATTQNMQNV